MRQEGGTGLTSKPPDSQAGPSSLASFVPLQMGRGALPGPQEPRTDILQLSIIYQFGPNAQQCLDRAGVQQIFVQPLMITTCPMGE